MTKKLMFESVRSQNFHRNREHPAPDPDEQPLNQIEFYLDRYKIKEALQVFFSDDTLSLLQNDWDFIWELIPIICKRLRGLCQYRFRVFEGCEKILCQIAADKSCNPKEVLIVLLAEISQRNDYNDDDNVFRAMMKPLELVLLRMSNIPMRNENLKWVLNVLISYSNSIELPDESQIDGTDRASLTNHPKIKRFVQILPSIIGLIDAFSERPPFLDQPPLPMLTDEQSNETSDGELNDTPTENNSIYSCDNSGICDSALLSLLSRPFASMDLTKERPDLRILAIRCTLKLLKLRPNLFSPIYKNLNDNLRDHDSNKNLSTDRSISLATCVYIYRCEHRGSIEDEHYFPRIISNESLLFSHLPYILKLMEGPGSLVLEKGLMLMENLLDLIEPNSLEENFLIQFEGSSVKDRLLSAMIYADLNTNRRKSYDVFVLICDLLTYDCKVKFLTDVLSRDYLRPCLRAACIDQYRRYLTNVHRRTSKTLSGQALVDFLELCIKICLPEPAKADVLEYYELFLATLNILRFLKLRKLFSEDPIEMNFLTANNLERQFFEPLRKGLTHTCNELRSHLKDAKKNKNQSGCENKVNEANNGENPIARLLEFYQMEKTDIASGERDEVECLSWLLCRLDLMASVLVRTCDIYNI